MGQIIQITAENLEACEGALSALRAELERLVRLTKDYPVECQFASYRFVFSTRADIQSVIDKLDDKIKAYRAAA